jgi:hypothetical protein
MSASKSFLRMLAIAAADVAISYYVTVSVWQPLEDAGFPRIYAMTLSGIVTFTVVRLWTEFARLRGWSE